MKLEICTAFNGDPQRRDGRGRVRQLTLVLGRRDQLPGFEVAFLAGGDQHRRLAVGCRRAESHVFDLGIVGG